MNPKPQGLTLFGFFQGAKMPEAGGAFGGVGVGLGVGHSDCPQKSGISKDKTKHMEFNLGTGDAAGVSVDSAENGSDGSVGGLPVPKAEFGGGVGWMVSSGTQTTYTAATPALW